MNSISDLDQFFLGAIYLMFLLLANILFTNKSQYFSSKDNYDDDEQV